jgi:DNA-binding transcriptional ArsR family regulator
LPTKSREIIDPQLAKALAHPLRVQLLSILNERVTSPNQLSKELDEPLGNVSYHVKVLLDYDCAELVKKEPRRGAIEHFYRATKRAYFNDPAWMALPISAQHGISRKLLEKIGKDALEALAAGTMTEREDTHLSHTPMVVDEQGWQDVTTLLKETLDRVLEIQAEAAGRLAGSHKKGMNTKVEMMHFKSPQPD